MFNNHNCIQDLEKIFKQGIKNGKLNAALKAKEMILKMKGLFTKKNHSNCEKKLSDWTDDELYLLLSQLEEENIL